MARLKLKVFYSCDGCDAKDEEVIVDARTSPEEDVSEWMKNTTKAVAEQHSHRHLFCESKKLKDLKIPLNKDVDGVSNWIGKPIA